MRRRLWDRISVVVVMALAWGAAGAQAELDWGDAPNEYGTTSASNGARHAYSWGVCLGSLPEGMPDLEADGQPSGFADGDGADEDGVEVIGSTGLIVGRQTMLRITSCSADLILNGWIDFNFDDDWNDPGEHVIDGLVLVAGENLVPVAVPDITTSYTYGRFRVSTVDYGDPLGHDPAPDGEVEDYYFDLVEPDLDYGDAAQQYPVYSGSDGARHIINYSTLYLGGAPDADPNGQASLAADGDDNDADGDDEDGVVFGDLVEGEDGTVTVTASEPGILDAWIDWNDDDDWTDAGEKVFDAVAVVAGSQDLPVAVPSGLSLYYTQARYARFRLSSAGTPNPTGEADDGEVEDYRPRVLPITDFSVSDASGYEGTASGGSTQIQFLVSRTDSHRAISIEYWTANGTATAGSDFTGISDTSPLLLSFAVGESSKNVSITISGDDSIEPDESFSLRIGNASADGVVFSDDEAVGTILQDEADFGDAPDTYFTTGGPTGGGAGPYHFIDTAVRLGAAIDVDADGQPTPSADGDDNDSGGDDEDGVTFLTPVAAGTTARLSVNASTAGYLGGWVDFDANGLWDSVFSARAVVAGPQILDFDVPESASPGPTFARFRFSTSNIGIGAPTGGASDGEVEDYAIEVVAATDFSIDDPEIVEGSTVDGQTQLVFSVTRNHSDAAASVDFAVTGGTATAGSDFATLSPGTLSFAESGALTKPIVIEVNGDDDVEATETVEITLSNSSVGSRITDAVGVGTILADELDYGDAPAPFPTLYADDGARHVAGPLFLGVTGAGPEPVDVEPDAHVSQTADGDDAHDANDDEEGIEFPEWPLQQGQAEPVTVTASASGLLDAWVDFNGNGVWESGEKIFAAEAVVAGTNVLQIDVPAGAATGFSMARFRLSTAGAATPTGLADDGEVEDHRLEIIEAAADTVPPRVVAVDTNQSTPGNDGLTPGETTSAYIMQVLVTYSEAMANPPGDGEPFDVTNPVNYLLIFDEGDGFTSSECVSRIVGNDWEVPLSGVTYEAGTRTATVTLALSPSPGEAPLPDGEYRFLACGSTTLEDESGNPLDGNGDSTGGDDFVLEFTLADTIPSAHPGDGREVTVNTSIVVGDFPSATGGTPPYTYSWVVHPQTGGDSTYTLDSPGDANPYFSASAEDEYILDLVITDSNDVESPLEATSVFVGCERLELFHDTIVGPATYKAIEWISAEDVTVAGSGTVFQAGNAIILMNEFLVEADADFAVVLDPTTNCDP